MICAHCRRRLDTDTARCPACAGDPLVGGGYRLDRVLVEHGDAVSYQATRRDDGLLVRICAVPLASTRLDAHTYALLLSPTLEHPNLAELIACVPTAEFVWLVQEQIPGQTLAELIEATPARWHESFALLELAAGLADGLALLHEHGLVHAGISAATVLLPSNGRPPLLLDPRLDPGKAPADDVHALGLVLAGAVCGLATAAIPDDWRDRVSDGALIALIDRMIAPNPEQRITSATLRDAIAGLLRVRAPGDDRRSPPTLPRASRPTPRFMMLEPPTPNARVGTGSQTSASTPDGKTAKPESDIPVMRPEDLSRELSQAHRATAAYEQRKRKHETAARTLVVVLIAIIVALGTYIALQAST